MILYIAGPISGMADRNVHMFENAEIQLSEAGYVVMNPAPQPGMENGADDLPQYYGLLKRDLRFLLECDGVAVLEGWWNSNGARNEVNCAANVGLPVRSVQEWAQIAETELKKPEWEKPHVQY